MSLKPKPRKTKARTKEEQDELKSIGLMVAAHRDIKKIRKIPKRKWIRKVVDKNSGKEPIIEKVYEPLRLTSGSFGRTYDCFEHKLNGKPINMWLDTTWGSWWHFEHNGIHYKLEVIDFGLPKMNLEITLEK